MRFAVVVIHFFQNSYVERLPAHRARLKARTISRGFGRTRRDFQIVRQIEEVVGHNMYSVQHPGVQRVRSGADIQGAVSDARKIVWIRAERH